MDHQTVVQTTLPRVDAPAQETAQEEEDRQVRTLLGLSMPQKIVALAFERPIYLNELARLGPEIYPSDFPDVDDDDDSN